jgi:hypothetical protein
MTVPAPDEDAYPRAEYPELWELEDSLDRSCLVGKHVLECSITEGVGMHAKRLTYESRHFADHETECVLSEMLVEVSQAISKRMAELKAVKDATHA